MIRRDFLLGLSSLLCLLPVLSASGELRLPAVIGDNMVLQRNQPLPIWGWAEPGASVQVQLGDDQAQAQADDKGKWMVRLPARQAGGPHQMTVSSGSQEKVVKNILVGEVWLCSGQSNMEWRVKQANNPDQEIAAANHPQIRHLKVQRAPSATPQEDVKTSGWQVCGPSTVGEFTAVGYYFARHLQKELNVPIGLLGSNWGGTRIGPWTPPEGFLQVESLKGYADTQKFPTQRGGKIVHQSPQALYNGMISPLVPYAIQGAIWYQGESNNGEGMAYLEKKQALVLGWRRLWKRDDLPFYYVQLAPFRYGRRNPTHLAEIWEAQLKALDKIPHTGMAVTTDIGNIRDIHPKNKQEVGRRLALWALAKTYDQKDVVYSGPLYKSMKVEGDKIRLHFDHVGGGLVSRDGKPLNWFTIAGKNGRFVEAQAEIDGETVVVHSPQVENPARVRFGWLDTAEPNLSNREGLPASPFRTE